MTNRLSDDDIACWQSVTNNTTAMGQRKQSISLPLSRSHNHFRPSPMDLHGHTVQAAYDRVIDKVEAADGHQKTVVVITGRGGSIQKEFEFWLESHPNVRRVEPLNGGGAFRIHLK